MGKVQEDDRELRREAIQIAAQLPREKQSALRVLALARVLVVKFLEAEDDGQACVLRPILSRPSGDRGPV